MENIVVEASYVALMKELLCFRCLEGHVSVLLAK